LGYLPNHRGHVEDLYQELITPVGADPILFNLAPLLAMAAVLGLWAVIPLSPTVFGTNINVGVLYLIGIGAIGELGIILAGLSSNNKYALLGGFRMAAQLLSYEVPMAITLLIPVMLTGSMGLNDIAAAQKIAFIFQAPVAALVFFITAIAENSRAPFDLMEADSEIVAGFNIEYSGLKFGMFYVADFLHAFTSALIFPRSSWADGEVRERSSIQFLDLSICLSRPRRFTCSR